MNSKIFRVAYFERPMHQSFVDKLQSTDGIELIKLQFSDGAQYNWKILASCHGYYARAARDELPREWHVTKELLARMPSLLLVASYGAGYDTIDVSACSAADVAVVNQAGGNAEGVAEHTLGMMLTLLKRIPEGNVDLRTGQIQRREQYMGRELMGRTIGLIGLGHVGTRLSSILRTAFDCKILAYDPYLDVETCMSRGAQKVELATLLRKADIVSLHCPLTEETREIMNKANFLQMQAGSIFISTARGSIHHEEDLLEAIESGHIAGAGLDVWDVEPPSSTHPLLKHARVISSPHIAGVTHESRQRVANMAADSFISLALGKLPERLLNPEISEQLMRRAGKVMEHI
ncbi:hypothetical protein CAP48_09200 [Advenella sp. S44]|uniref:NAD(P)-dependent oxidoreductase n=1 Tax=Advenella sp. S44 TaxID=1982755 RepID=UPI000C2A2F7B|nr:hydroxyacid dehydrogenase [Advenella sp. S44]PJX26173.1 hypothetical protein CAP48_09200 [Advenella sp. S44]